MITIDARTSAIVTYGPAVRADAGDLARRAAARAAGAARRGGLGVPPRSSFGARLRSRVPQYGHSVMYGDTSEPQLLQTTKRSGPLAMDHRFYASRSGRFGPTSFTTSEKSPFASYDDPLAMGARSRARSGR